MKNPLCLTAAFFCLFAHPAAFGNGGTFDSTDVKATGNLIPQRKNRIILDKEALNVRLSGDEAEVDVTYTLRNTGGADKVTYGFPIDTSGNYAFGDGSETDDTGISGYRIEDGGRKLAVNKVIKKPATPGPDEQYGATVRNWYMSDLEFAKGETKTLHVAYKTKVLGSETGTSKQAYWGWSPLTFLYTLKPSQSWGNGRVGQLDISIDVSDIRKATDKIDVKFPGAGSTESGNRIVWHFKDYDLGKSPDLTLTYDNSMQLLNQEMMADLLPRKYIESIRASSTYPPSKKGFTYGVENLLDGKLDTAWIEGAPGPGIGEWIEITFKDNVAIKAIGVINGYCKSGTTLDENGEVLQLQVDATVAYGTGRKFEHYNEKTTLERTKYSDPYAKFPAALSQLVFDGGEGPTIVKKIILKITGAEQGSKYAQAALGKLIICGYPVKK